MADNCLRAPENAATPTIRASATDIQCDDGGRADTARDTPRLGDPTSRRRIARFRQSASGREATGFRQPTPRPGTSLVLATNPTLLKEPEGRQRNRRPTTTRRSPRLWRKPAFGKQPAVARVRALRYPLDTSGEHRAIQTDLDHRWTKPRSMNSFMIYLQRNAEYRRPGS